MKKDTSASAGRQVGRRAFLSTSAAAAGFTLVRPEAVAGTKANSKIELGLVGCGNRGKWIIPLFLKHGGYAITTCADYYPYKVDEFGSPMKIDPGSRISAGVDR